MSKITYQEDYRFARRICEALRAGMPEAIEDVYRRYHPVFLNFTRKRLKGWADQRIDDLLSRFWIELMDGKAICRFEGNSPLKSFLMGRLNFRIKDEWRRFVRDRRRYDSMTGEDDDEGPKEDRHPSPTPSAEAEMARKERDRLVRGALLYLEAIHLRDASLVKMHLEGMTYGEMAAEELSGEDADEAALGRREDAIKKQFTRKRTGSLAKFKEVLERRMVRMGCDIDDLIG